MNKLCTLPRLLLRGTKMGHLKSSGYELEAPTVWVRDDSLSCDGPLFTIDGDDIAFNAAGCSFDVNGISLLCSFNTTMLLIGK